MNLNQKQNILDILQKLLDTNVKRLLLDTYNDESNYKNVIISKYSGADFLYLLERLIKNFKNELEGKYGLLLPATENYSNDFGTVNLKQDLQSLYSNILEKQFETSESILEKLIHYQIKNDIWKKSETKNIDTNSEVIREQFLSIDLNQKAMDKNIEAFTDLKSKFQSEISTANKIVSAKKSELIEITDFLSSARNQVNTINELVASSSNRETEITGILKNLNEKLTSITETIESNEEEFTKMKAESSELVESLNSSLNLAASNMNKTESELSYIESKKKEIETLTGLAADGSLGSKFNQRKTELTSSVNNWTIAIIVTTIFAAFWIYFVFVVLNANLSNEWINLLVNVIKTSPAFILVGFVFSRYSKERTLEEEYAFKSTIAMTLTAYSQMLESEDSEDNISRQQMLMRSIEMIYTQPKLYHEKHEISSSNVIKQLKETMDTIAESVKNIKGV
ncbi:MAG: hypothetical protein IPN73_02015 [Saprospiraceae bacterium]|nr:hypothetical protein [Saprospiraceae bacterium]